MHGAGELGISKILLTRTKAYAHGLYLSAPFDMGSQAAYVGMLCKYSVDAAFLSLHQPVSCPRSRRILTWALGKRTIIYVGFKYRVRKVGCYVHTGTRFRSNV